MTCTYFLGTCFGNLIEVTVGFTPTWRLFVHWGILTWWVTKAMKYDSIICQLRFWKIEIWNITYVSLPLIYRISRIESRLTPQLNLEGENGYVIQVTTEVPTCPKCKKKTNPWGLDYCVDTKTKVLNKQDFGRSDILKLHVLLKVFKSSNPTS